MENEEREELVRELLKKAYDLYQTTCRIRGITPLSVRAWALSVGLG